jgi:thiol-disulfide isomerase/thioredoxin
MEHLDRRTALRWGAVAVAGGLAAAVSACSSDPNSVADQARSGDRKGYVAGDGSIEQRPVTERGEPVKLSGTTLEGKPWSLAERAGTVLVVNVWGSWCPPCIEETPALQKAWEAVQSKGKKVEFVGLDKLEGPETGLAFQTANKVTYPSLAYDGGVPLLALQGKASATPTTLVLDHEARIAARVSGPVSTTTLLGLIDDVLAEKA